MLIRNGLQLRCVVWVLRGVAWGCVGLRGVAWGCVGLRGFAWGCMGLHGAAWGCVGLRGAAWGCVGLRGAAWGGATVLDHRYIMNQHIPTQCQRQSGEGMESEVRNEMI